MKYFKMPVKYFKIPGILALALLMSGSGITASAQDELRSRRNSICSMMVRHGEQKFADEIEEQFLRIPVSPRFNDHNLAVRVVSVEDKKVKDEYVTDFVNRNHIASRLVAKWFDRDILTGACTMDTIKSRGLYDASAFDMELASRSARGLAMLQDAGEDLIGNTYLLVNEINYVDKAKRSALWGTIGGIAMGALAAYAGGSVSDINNMMKNTSDIISSYKGFTVKIKTRLYRLRWTEEDANLMYSELWASAPDEQRRTAFENARGKFALEYVAEVTSKGSRTSFLGINEDEPVTMIRKACARAIDENVADLQHKYEPFRIKTPIRITDSGEIMAPIGLKEGITPSTKFEVLEVEEKDGKVSYHRVGIVKPVDNKIWDNRYMAVEEGAFNANLGATSFRSEKGSDFVSGMLIREID